MTISDADGRFRISGASGGRYRVGGAARGKLGIAQLVSVEPGVTVDVVVRMVPSSTVRGHVVVHGAPLAGARVTVRSGNVVVRHDDPSHDEIAVGDRDGLPVVGALVRLIADDAEPLETHSVADGRFDFGLQSARMITLGAAVPGSLAPIRHVDLRDPTTSADVELY